MSRTIAEVSGEMDAVVEKLEALHAAALDGGAPSAENSAQHRDSWEEGVLSLFNAIMAIKPDRSCAKAARTDIELLGLAVYGLSMDAYHDSIPGGGWARGLWPLLRLARRIQRRIRTVSESRIDSAAEAWLRRQLDGLTGGA